LSTLQLIAQAGKKNKMIDQEKKIVIKGVTQEGAKFRPSDWATRLTNAVSKPGRGGRLIYNPKVKMALIDGINCVVIDPSLESEEPMLYAFLINFATTNNLQVETPE